MSLENTSTKAPYRYDILFLAVATSTPALCYPADIMYQDNVVKSIKQSKNDIAIPISLLRTNATGISFQNVTQPTFSVQLNNTLISRIISISVSNRNSKTNVNQIELTFYDKNNVILQNSDGKNWVVQTTLGVTKVCFIVSYTRK